MSEISIIVHIGLLTTKWSLRVNTPASRGVCSKTLRYAPTRTSTLHLFITYQKYDVMQTYRNVSGRRRSKNLPPIDYPLPARVWKHVNSSNVNERAFWSTLYVSVSVLLGKLDFELVTPPPPGHCAQPMGGQGLFVFEAERSRSETRHSPGLLWTSDQPDAETSYYTQHSQETDIYAPCGIRTSNPTSERQQTHALERGRGDRQICK
jgi:hypothetical protein